MESKPNTEEPKEVRDVDASPPPQNDGGSNEDAKAKEDLTGTDHNAKDDGNDGTSKTWN